MSRLPGDLRAQTLIGARPRRSYLDWLRGLAVIIMIEAHLIDSWTRAADRHSRQFAWGLIVGGFGAPLFLFLAGVAVALSAGSKLRRSGDVRAASRAVLWRGLEIYGLALLFRVQAWILGWSSPRLLLKVDILNIMGPSIMAAAALWGAMSTRRARLIAFTIATLAMTLLTPIVRTWPAVGSLPDPVEAYIRPAADLSNFVFFPWAGFVFAGALVGVLLDAVNARDDERRINVWLAIAGVVMAVGAYEGSFLPTLYRESRFWTTSPSFFFLRLGLLVAAIPLAYLWHARPRGEKAWSPLQQLGRSSLFIYWIHVEMVYGLVSLRWHKHLSIGQAWVALVAFSFLMLLFSLLKDRVVEWWNHRPPRGAPVTAASA